MIIFYDPSIIHKDDHFYDPSITHIDDHFYDSPITHLDDHFYDPSITDKDAQVLWRGKESTIGTHHVNPVRNTMISQE